MGQSADYTVASPAPNAAGIAILGQASANMEGAQDRTDAAEKTRYTNDVYNNRTLPQLQSGIGAAGQWYSGAAGKAQLNANADVNEQKYDISSALDRNLNDLTRQRMYASLGLVV